MKYRRISIHGNILINVFTEGQESHAKCIRGLPKGTKFAYSIPDTSYGIWLVIEHESFDDLKDGDIIPIMPSPLMESTR